MFFSFWAKKHYPESAREGCGLGAQGKQRLTLNFTSNLRIQSEAWNITHGILSSQTTALESKLFAATTLKWKVGVHLYLRDRVHLMI